MTRDILLLSAMGDILGGGLNFHLGLIGVLLVIILGLTWR